MADLDMILIRHPGIKDKDTQNNQCGLFMPIV